MYWPFHLPHFAELPIITYPTSANVTYSEREAVIISCKTTGQPVPDVSWIHNGRVKFSGSKTAIHSILAQSAKLMQDRIHAKQTTLLELQKSN